MDKLKILYPVIVEGKYDKIKLDSIIDANIIRTDGFGIFKKDELKDILRRLADKFGKVIVLTDSDGAGRVIRSHLRGILPKGSIIDLYTPDIKGKEKRKTSPSAAGLLGVEGMEADLLRELFRPFSDSLEVSARGDITKLDFYEDGLSGGAGASGKRERFCRCVGLPKEMSANALLSAINMLYTRQEYYSVLERIEEEQ